MLLISLLELSFGKMLCEAEFSKGLEAFEILSLDTLPFGAIFSGALSLDADFLAAFKFCGIGFSETSEFCGVGFGREIFSGV